MPAYQECELLIDTAYCTLDKTTVEHDYLHALHKVKSTEMLLHLRPDLLCNTLLAAHAVLHAGLRGASLPQQQQVQLLPRGGPGGPQWRAGQELRQPGLPRPQQPSQVTTGVFCPVLHCCASSAGGGYSGLTTAGVSSPYSGQGRLLQQAPYHGSPHIQAKSVFS